MIKKKKIQMYKPSLQVIVFIKHYEQLHDGSLKMIGLQPKPDARGIWTEGYGHAMVDRSGKFRTTKDYPTIQSILPYQTVYTEKEALYLLERDVNIFANGVNRRLKIKVSQHQFDALVSHAYNCGFSETLYRRVNSRASEKDIKSWFTTKYITADGQYLKGLQYRRNDEYQIWAGINYEREYNLSV